jgi:hypothetical protein
METTEKNKERTLHQFRHGSGPGLDLELVSLAGDQVDFTLVLGGIGWCISFSFGHFGSVLVGWFSVLSFSYENSQNTKYSSAVMVLALVPGTRL